MSDSIFQQAQDLETDPIVELWELDTTILTNVFGVTGTGGLYRWTPGVLNYRHEDVVISGSTTTFVAMAGDFTYTNTALTYTMQVEDPTTGQWCDPIKIVGVAKNTPITFTGFGLETPVPFPPVAGARLLIESTGKVMFGGVEYVPAPIELTGMEWSGQGKLPRPTLRCSNLGGLAAALVIEFGDIVGGIVKRTQTFKSFLDGEPNANPSAVFEPDIFVVDRKATHNKHVIEFELAAGLDQQGIRVPKRIVLRNSCDQTYRQWTNIGGFGHFVYGTCPYVGNAYFKDDGTPSGLPQDDLCGKRLTDCLLRFPNNARLPFRGFPGVAEVKV
jgi:lambda family phage minor tail protein L